GADLKPENIVEHMMQSGRYEQTVQYPVNECTEPAQTEQKFAQPFQTGYKIGTQKNEQCRKKSGCQTHEQRHKTGTAEKLNVFWKFNFFKAVIRDGRHQPDQYATGHSDLNGGLNVIFRDSCKQ